MKVDKVDEVSIARGVFVSSFAVFIFTALFASAAAGSGLLGGDMTATAYYANGTNRQVAQKLAIAKAPASRYAGDEADRKFLDTDRTSGGGASNNVGSTVAVDQSAPTVTISVSPETVKYGGEARVQWTSTNALSCVITSATAPAPVPIVEQVQKSTAGKTTVSVQNTRAAVTSGKIVQKTFAKTMQSIAPEGVPTGALYTNTVFTATCKGANSTVGTASATVTVEAPVAPTVSITAEPAKIAYNTATKITWTSENAKSCKVTTGEVAEYDDFDVYPLRYAASKTNQRNSGVTVFATGLNNVGKDTTKLKASKTYTLTCAGEGNTTATSKVVVEVEAPAKPVVTITATPETIEYNTASTISWTSENATKCNVKKDTANFAGQMTNEGMSSGKLKKTTKFSVECTGEGGTETATVNVVVNPAVRPTAKITVDAPEVDMNGSVKVSWTSTGADTCKVTKNTASLSTKVEGTEVASGTLKESTVFWISCTSDGGTVVDSVSVQVKPTEAVSAAETSAAAKSNGGGSVSGTAKLEKNEQMKDSTLLQRSAGAARN